MDLFQNPDDKLYVWEKLFTPVMNEYFPIKKKRIRRNSHPWVNREILIMMRNRDRLRKIALKSGLNNDYKLYKQARNGVTSNIRKARIDYFKRELHESPNE